MRSGRRYSETDLKVGTGILGFLTLLLIIWLGAALIKDVHACLTQGFATPVPLNFRFRGASGVPMLLPLWGHLLIHLAIGTVWSLVLWWAFRECRESLDEIRVEKAGKKFDKVMERIRRGEDIDDILKDR